MFFCVTNVGLSARGSIFLSFGQTRGFCKCFSCGRRPLSFKAHKQSLKGLSGLHGHFTETGVRKGKNPLNLWVIQVEKKFTGVPGDSWGVLGDFPAFSRVVFFIIFDRTKAGKVHVKVQTPRQRPSTCNFQASGSFKPPQAAPTIEDTYSCETRKFGNTNHRSTNMYIIESNETYLQGISRRNGG